jgi:hypothetical protein
MESLDHITALAIASKLEYLRALNSNSNIVHFYGRMFSNLIHDLPSIKFPLDPKKGYPKNAEIWSFGLFEAYTTGRIALNKATEDHVYTRQESGEDFLTNSGFLADCTEAVPDRVRYVIRVLASENTARNFHPLEDVYGTQLAIVAPKNINHTRQGTRVIGSIPTREVFIFERENRLRSATR